jgi:hypothetical protein
VPRDSTHSPALRPFRYADLFALGVAAPVVLLSHGSAAGYGVGAATWVVLRALGAAVDSAAGAITELSQQIALRLGYRLVRIVLLSGAAIGARAAVDADAGITALAVIASAFTIQLVASLIGRSGRPRESACAGP